MLLRVHSLRICCETVHYFQMEDIFSRTLTCSNPFPIDRSHSRNPFARTKQGSSIGNLVTNWSNCLTGEISCEIETARRLPDVDRRDNSSTLSHFLFVDIPIDQLSILGHVVIESLWNGEGKTKEGWDNMRKVFPMRTVRVSVLTQQCEQTNWLLNGLVLGLERNTNWISTYWNFDFEQRNQKSTIN